MKSSNVIFTTVLFNLFVSFVLFSMEDNLKDKTVEAIINLKSKDQVLSLNPEKCKNSEKCAAITTIRLLAAYVQGQNTTKLVRSKVQHCFNTVHDKTKVYVIPAFLYYTKLFPAPEIQITFDNSFAPCENNTLSCERLATKKIIEQILRNLDLRNCNLNLIPKSCMDAESFENLTLDDKKRFIQEVNFYNEILPGIGIENLQKACLLNMPS